MSHVYLYLICQREIYTWAIYLCFAKKFVYLKSMNYGTVRNTMRFEIET
jgi:hypothetical protein